VPEIGKRIVNMILRFGIEQQAEHARVLFCLHDFDSLLLHDRLIADRLQKPIVHVRHQALRSNSSDAVVNIQVLLVAPTISGRDGVRDALTGLTNILSSAQESRISIALPEAYAPILLLANQQKKIAYELLLELNEFRSWLVPLMSLVEAFWDYGQGPATYICNVFAASRDGAESSH
jgi:hypothetical protein